MLQSHIAFGDDVFLVDWPRDGAVHKHMLTGQNESDTMNVVC
jgi:hypothetical protein